MAQPKVDNSHVVIRTISGVWMDRQDVVRGCVGGGGGESLRKCYRGGKST